MCLLTGSCTINVACLNHDVVGAVNTLEVLPEVHMCAHMNFEP